MSTEDRTSLKKCYDYLLSFNMTKPAKNKFIPREVTDSQQVFFNPKEHEFFTSTVRHDLSPEKHQKIKDPLSLGNVLNLVQFITKYWDPFKNPGVTLLWITNNPSMRDEEIFKQLFLNINLITAGRSDSEIKNDQSKLFLWSLEDILSKIDNDIFLFWDSDMVLEESLLEKINPIYLQITMNHLILKKYGEMFWNGRIYFSVNAGNDNKTRLVTSDLKKKVGYYSNVYNRQITSYYLFLSSITFNVDNSLYHVVGLGNDWGSSLTINILKEYIEKTKIDNELPTKNKRNYLIQRDESVYNLIREHLLVKKVSIRRYVDVVRKIK